MAQTNLSFLFLPISLLSILNIQAKIDLLLRQAEENKTLFTVGKDGSGNFKSIKAAIKRIPQPNKGRVIICIKPGIYREKIEIDQERPFVTLKACDNNHPPTITWSDTHRSSGNSTLLSATVTVNSDYFMAIDIIFENPTKHKWGDDGSQVVALQISGTKGAFYNCVFNGYQDTLHDRKGLHYFRGCSISGDVDFICGAGQSLYEDCVLKYVGNHYEGSITAQLRTEVSLSSGFSFVNCNVIGVGTSEAYLGRPWGGLSRVVFSYTYMDKIVIPKGCDDWSKPYYQRTVYYAEYMCTGPRSNRAGRVPWARALTYEEAQPFIGRQFVEGDTWILDPY